MTHQDDYAVDCEARPDTATLSGVMRLQSVQAYERLFAPLEAGLGKCEGPYTIDITAVSLMNSSGIRALAALVLAARRSEQRLVVVGRESVAWQRKTVSSLGALYEGLTVRME